VVSAQYLKRLLRTYVHADKRFSVDVDPRSAMLPLTARRLDRGEYPVIYTSHAPYAPLGAANHLGRQLAGRPALFLLWFSWTMRQPSVVRKLSTSVAVYRRKWPEHRFILLCNEEEERSAFVAAGVDAVLCSSNAFVDEVTFRPVPEVEQDYDAVYNAAMMPWKRHGLASSVETCAHIFYQKDHYGQKETLSYLASLRSKMPHHRFVNEVADGKIAMIASPEVNSVLAQSRVGLCLSAEEGAMFASMEYLLAGLPVVSTPNIGGRDMFSDPEFWLTVPDTTTSISNAVAEMASRRVPAARIRARTLERVHEHRARLRSAVADATAGSVVLPSNLGDSVYRKVPTWASGPELAAQVGIGAGQ
jgi:glycosyltransferase involved in cell wall biosynthesis